MQVFQVLDGLTVDVPAIAAWTGARKSELADFSVRAGWVTLCIAKGVEASAIAAYRASAQHWSDYGADYRAVVQFVWALWLIQAREVMECDTSEEMATAVALLPEVVAIQGRVQGVVQAIAASRWSEFRDWALATRVVRQAIVKYEAMRVAFWLVAVAK